MPRRVAVPKYCLQKSSGQAYVYLSRKRIYLGVYGSPESHRKYGEVLAGLHASRDAEEPVPDGVTVNELCLRYVTEKLPGYSKAERACWVPVVRLLRELFGETSADEFGPLRLRVLRDAMVAGDPAAIPPRKPWSRYTVNRQTKRVVALFAWGSGWELVPATVVNALRNVGTLAAGESDACESSPRLAVPQEQLTAVRGVLRELHRDIFDLLLLTGARPGEILSLTGRIIERTGEVWRAELRQHKTARKGKRRVLFFNRTAQAILLRHLKSDPDKKLFSMRRDSFGHTFARACERAGVTPFVPHQLRHTVATKLADEMGIEAAQRLLGHCDSAMTEHYSRAAERQALAAAQSLG